MQLQQQNVTNNSSNWTWQTHLKATCWCIPMSLDVLVAPAAGGWQPVFSLHSSHKTFKSLKFNFPPPQHRINHLQILIFFWFQIFCLQISKSKSAVTIKIRTIIFPTDPSKKAQDPIRIPTDPIKIPTFRNYDCWDFECRDFETLPWLPLLIFAL